MAQTTEQRELTPRDPPVIELLDPGAEPRGLLRLQPAPATETPLEIDLALTMRVRAGGTALPAIVTPIIRLRGRLVVDAVHDDSISVRHIVDAARLVDRPDATPALRDELRRGLVEMGTFRASLRIDARGMVHGGTVDVPAVAEGPGRQLLQQLAEGYQQALVPLPEAAIGAGARWTATRDLDQEGMKLREVVTYRLRAVDGRRVEIEAKMSQTLRDPNVAPGSLPGVRAKMIRFSAGGEGEIAFTTDHVVPESSTLRTDVRMVMDVATAGETTRQEIDLQADLAFRRGE